MKPFERACYGDDLTPERLVADFGISIDEAREQAARMRECMVWQNDEFEVAISKIASQFGDAPPLLHLSIKRRDKGAIHDWRKYLYLSAVHSFLRESPAVDVHIVTQESEE